MSMMSESVAWITALWYPQCWTAYSRWQKILVSASSWLEQDNSGTTAVSVVVNNTAVPGSFSIPSRISLNPCGSEQAFFIHDSAMKFRRAALFASFTMKFFQCGMGNVSWMSYVLLRPADLSRFKRSSSLSDLDAVTVCWICRKHYRKVFLLQFLECGAIKIAIMMYERHHVDGEMWGVRRGCNLILFYPRFTKFLTETNDKISLAPMRIP